MRLHPNSVETPEAYYDRRHEAGWVDHWPGFKKLRVVKLVEKMRLNSQARVLEFGCGVGVFTDAVKTALPFLEIHGCDISPTAITKGRKRFAGVQFHLIAGSGIEPPIGTLDLLFTHHVLEHVLDLPSTIRLMSQMVKPGGKVLHILPCGNPGSLESNIAEMVQDGVLPSENGLLCCDDSSHVRRLSSEELECICRANRLVLRQAFFANQFWGAIEYLTDEYHWTLMRWLNPLRGINLRAKLRLLSWFCILLSISLIRKLPGYVIAQLRNSPILYKRLFYCGLLPFAFAVYPLSYLLNKFLQWARDLEWERRKTVPSGSEMYLLFEKSRERL